MKAASFALLLMATALAAHPLCCQAQLAAPLQMAEAQAAEQGGSLKAAASAFREGYAATQHNDLATARRSFERAVSLAPEVSAGHAALGSVLLSLGDLDSAIRELETARQLDGSDQSILLNLCVAYSSHQDYAKAVAAYTDFERKSASPSALPSDAATAVATAFVAIGDPKAAREVIQRSLKATPDDAPLQDALGTLFAQQRDYGSAEDRFRRAIVIDPSLASAHYHLGSVESATSRETEALGELSRACALSPGNVQYALDLARLLLDDRQAAKAIELLRPILAKLSVQSDAQAIEVKYRLALALQAADKVKEAMPLFTEVVAARPDDAEALTNTALAHVQLGDAKGGISIYLQALKLTPSSPTLREDLGVAYLQQADLDHALEQFRAGLLIDDQSPQLHYDLALALKLKDDLAAAIPEFERAAALDPQLPDPPFTLGIIYMQQGKFEKSAASFEAATALRPENGEAWATLGSVYQQMQQPDKAIPALRRAIALMPQQPSPHITLAAALSAQGHREEAAAERKIGASLSRAATNRQKAKFGLDSGNLLMKRGQTVEALAQFQDAVEADPSYAAPHLALAGALDHAGRKAEAAEERHKALALDSSAPPTPQ